MWITGQYKRPMFNPFIYQRMKPVIVEILGLSKDSIHIYVGFFAYLLCHFLWKKKRHSPLILVPGIALSLVMEIMDFWGDAIMGRDLQYLASLHDVINTNLIAVIVFFCFNYKKKTA